MRKQSAIDRAVEVLKKDPDMTNQVLRARAGVSLTTINQARKRCGILAPITRTVLANKAKQ